MVGYDTGPTVVFCTGGLSDCRFAICKYMCGKYCWKVCVQYFMWSPQCVLTCLYDAVVRSKCPFLVVGLLSGGACGFIVSRGKNV